MHKRAKANVTPAKVVGIVLIALLLSIGIVASANWWGKTGQSRSGHFHTSPGNSYHARKSSSATEVSNCVVSPGPADKRLIRLSSQLGFNGVQFQIEGSTVQGIKDFAKRDADEHLVDFCHSLGMKVTLWVHEMSDVPAKWMPESLGPVNVDNAALWAKLDDRYETMLRDTVPNIDG